MPGIGTEAAVFLYAGLSGMTVFFAYRILGCIRKIGGRSGGYPLLDRGERIPVLLYVYHNIWKHKMVLCAGDPERYFRGIFSGFAGAETGGGFFCKIQEKP